MDLLTKIARAVRCLIRSLMIEGASDSDRSSNNLKVDEFLSVSVD